MNKCMKEKIMFEKGELTRYYHLSDLIQFQYMLSDSYK
jgi:hypothetical protein